MDGRMEETRLDVIVTESYSTATTVDVNEADISSSPLKDVDTMSPRDINVQSTLESKDTTTVTHEQPPPTSDSPSWCAAVVPQSAVTSVVSDDSTTSYMIDIPANCVPVIMMVNRKSGGQAGNLVLKTSLRHLHILQVCDMIAEGEPEQTLFRFRHLHHLILVCGGDGTIRWLFSAIDAIHYDSAIGPPPVGIMPLGTGNDLSRILGWGPGSSGQSVLAYIDRVLRSNVSMLDRWTIHTTENSGDPPSRVCCCMNNYFSLGVDAKVALEWHETRERHPERFSSRLANKLYYVKFGLSNLINNEKHLKHIVRIEADGEFLTLSDELEGVIVLNINSYGAGCDLWGDGDETGGMGRSSWSDRRLEVVGLKGVSHMGRIQAHLGKGVRLAQCSMLRITFISSAGLPVQIDGEPSMQAPCIMDIRPLGQSPVLIPPKR